jgi:uncharacterized protein
MMVAVARFLGGASRIREGLAAVKAQLTDRGPVMMMLGPFMFGVHTAAPQQVARSNSYSWAALDRVGERPLLQFTGVGGERFEIDGVILPFYKGGQSQVQAMRELAGTGKRWLLVDSTGRVYGLCAIVAIEEKRSVFTRRGAAKRIDFRLTLEYAGD